MNNKIILGYGLMGPCFTDEKDFKEAYESCESAVTKDFGDNYIKLLDKIDVLTNCAKSYIFENYKKVKDWSKLDIVLIDRNPNIEGSLEDRKVHFYDCEKPKQRKFGKGASDIINDMFEEIDNDQYENRNPVKSVSKVVLDPSDGDFSVTVNDREFWWINTDSIIVLAKYIEENI